MNMITRRAMTRAIGAAIAAVAIEPAAAIDHAAPGNGHIPIRASYGPFSHVPWRFDADWFLDDVTISSFDDMAVLIVADACACAEILLDDWRDDYDYDVAFIAPNPTRDDARGGWIFRVNVVGPDIPSFAHDVGFENVRAWK